MIVCPNCGEKLQDGTRFCAKCGTRLPDPAPVAEEELLETEPVAAEAKYEAPAAEKKPLNLKMIGICAAAVLVVLLAVLILPGLFSGGGSSALKDYVTINTIEEDWIGLSKSGKFIKQDSEGLSIRNSYRSADGTMLYFTTQEDKTLSLWSFNGSKFVKVVEEIKTPVLLSYNGKAVAYRDSEDNLYIYNGSKSVKVAEEVESLNCISPDGKAVGYTKSSNDNTRGYYYDGKEREIGKNTTPSAISAGAKYVYFLNQKSILYVQKGDDADSRVKLLDTVKAYSLNEDGTQFYGNDGEKTYFSENGKERVEMSKEILTFVRPAQSVAYGRFIGVSSFKNQLFSFAGSDGRNISRFALKGDKFEATSVVRNVSSTSLSADGKTLTYMKNDDLYQINATKSGAEGKKLADDIEDYLISYDGKAFLYESEDNEMFYMTSSGKATKILDESVDDACQIGSSGFLYILEDELFYTNGGKGTRVSGLSGDVEQCSSIYYYGIVETEDAYYFTKDGKKMTKITDK